MPSEHQDLANICQCDLDHLDISEYITLVQCIDDIMLIRSDKVANTWKILVSHMHSD